MKQVLGLAKAKRTASALALALALAALTFGCGGGGSASLTPDEQLTVAAFESDVAGAAIDPLIPRLADSTDAMIALARAKPDAQYEGASMAQVMSDAAGELEVTNPDLSAKLDRAVATLD